MLVKAMLSDEGTLTKEWVEENQAELLEMAWRFMPFSSLPGGPGPAWWNGGSIKLLPEFTNAQQVAWANLWHMTPVELDIDEQILKVILRVPERSPR